jgi:hypothetical protein
VDITEFAPKSVKSDGDFEDILAADRPDVWESHRPAEGGAAGAMLSEIISRAARLKAGRLAAAGANAAAVKVKGKREKVESPSRKKTVARKTAAKKKTQTKR